MNIKLLQSEIGVFCEDELLYYLSNLQINNISDKILSSLYKKSCLHAEQFFYKPKIEHIDPTSMTHVGLRYAFGWGKIGVDIIKKIKKNKIDNILEFGAGCGHWTYTLQKNNINSIATDNNKEQKQWINFWTDIYHGNSIDVYHQREKIINKNPAYLFVYPYKDFFEPVYEMADIGSIFVLYMPPIAGFSKSLCNSILKSAKILDYLSNWEDENINNGIIIQKTSKYIKETKILKPQNIKDMIEMSHISYSCWNEAYSNTMV